MLPFILAALAQHQLQRTMGTSPEQNDPNGGWKQYQGQATQQAQQGEQGLDVLSGEKQMQNQPVGGGLSGMIQDPQGQQQNPIFAQLLQKFFGGGGVQ